MALAPLHGAGLVAAFRSAGFYRRVLRLVALLAAGGPIAPEQTPKRPSPDPESASPAKADGKAAAAKRPGKAKAKPTKAKTAAAKRPAKAKAKG